MIRSLIMTVILRFIQHKTIQFFKTNKCSLCQNVLITLLFWKPKSSSRFLASCSFNLKSCWGSDACDSSELTLQTQQWVSVDELELRVAQRRASRADEDVSASVSWQDMFSVRRLPEVGSCLCADQRGWFKLWRYFSRSDRLHEHHAVCASV